MELHFFNSDVYPTYEAAKADKAIYKCDAPLDEDQFDQWGWDGGILCDAMQAVQAALECVNMHTKVEIVLVDRGKVVGTWRD